MKPSTKEGGQTNVLCRQHKEKCVFVCLFKTCKDAFKVGCMRCRKEHSQHPNRLISLGDFHPMLSRPIRYLQNLTAFKLMNLKKKIEYIRNFRTDILDKETQLMESNRHIKGTITAILEEHYIITDVVSHIDSETLTNNYDEYADSLQRCKDFLAYNPVKCELVFNNQVIKNSRIQLEKHLKTSHELIDNIRELLVKIIEVLLANCAHDEDDDEIEFAQEGDSATTFNIFIKHRTDVSENPNIKSKLQHKTFLEMFDQEKQAFTKEIRLLEKEIDIKSSILKKIKSSKQGDKDSISERSEHEEIIKREIDLDPLEDLRNENKQLREQLENYQLQIQALREFKQNVPIQECEAEGLTQTCTSLASKTDEMTLNQANVAQLCKNEIQKWQQQLAKEKEKSVATIKDLENKVLQLSSLSNKQTSQLSTLSKKCSVLQLEASKKRQEQQSDKLSSKSSQEQLMKKICDISGKLAKKEEETEKKERDVQKQKKKYADLQKLVEKMKQNSASIERESQKWREEYQSREKYMRGELEKSQKELQTLKYKSRNDEERNKNIESKIKELNKEIQAKNQMIREKDRVMREKEQQWQSKTSVHSSRVKQLESELKTSRTSESLAKSYDEEVKKHKQTKELLEMSIKKGQELKDRIFELETELIENKDNRECDKSKESLMNESNIKGRNKVESRPNTNIFTPEQFHIETVNSQELLQEGSPKKEEPLKEKKLITNKEEKRLAYLEIKSIFRAVTEDMGILQQRLKENTVIQKVYLKELERKRNENKILKKELENIKVYGGNFKQPTQNPTSVSQTPRLPEKEKKQAKSPSTQINKIQPLSGMRKKA